MKKSMLMSDIGGGAAFYRGLAITAVALTISACGGGGGSDSDSAVSTTAVPAAATTSVPASAGASWPAMFAYIRAMPTSDANAPFTTELVTNPPKDESAEPNSLI